MLSAEREKATVTATVAVDVSNGDNNKQLKISSGPGSTPSLCVHMARRARPVLLWFTRRPDARATCHMTFVSTRISERGFLNRNRCFAAIKVSVDDGCCGVFHTCARAVRTIRLVSLAEVLKRWRNEAPI